MRRVPYPWACLALLGLRSWEGEAGSCQVPALGLACESACVSLIRPLSSLLSFPLAPPSYTPAGVTKMPLWGWEELPGFKQNHLHDLFLIHVCAVC